MNRGEGTTAKRIRRILVGLDASASSLAALEAAARLAAEFEAELEGLFVEDINLRRFAGLPFARVVDPLSAAARGLELEELERGLLAQAGRARRALAEAAGTRVTWRFRVVRGGVEQEFLAAAREADLISLGFVGGGAGAAARVGSLARRTVLESSHSVLLLRRPITAGVPVVVYYDAGPDSDQALASATSLANALDSGITVITSATTDDERQQLEAAIAQRLGAAGLEGRVRHRGAAGDRGLHEALQAAQGGVLVLSAHSPVVERERLGALLDTCSCSLWLIR